MPEQHPAYAGFPQNKIVNGIILPGGLLPEGATKMIMGTFPPPAVMERYGQGNPFFYYNSSRNHFWNRIESFVPYPPGYRWKWLNGAAETEAQNVDRKVALAQERHWAFMDFFSEVDRIENNADDDNLVNVQDVVSNHQLFDALDALPEVRQVLCTYLTAFDNLLFRLGQLGYAPITVPEPLTANGIKYNWNYNNRAIEIILLYPASRSRHTAAIKNQQYNHYLQ